MNTKLLVSCFLIIVCFFIVSCKYDKQQIADSATTCDTAGMTYTINIEPIIKANCYSCHAGTSPSSFINLDSYTDLKSEAEPGILLERLMSNDPTEWMPQNQPKLPICDINKINAWIQAGMPQ